MSSLIDDLVRPPSRQKPCKFTLVVEELTVDEQALVNEIASEMIDATIKKLPAKHTFAWLARVLTKNGHPISECSVARHMKGQCTCERT